MKGPRRRLAPWGQLRKTNRSVAHPLAQAEQADHRIEYDPLSVQQNSLGSYRKGVKSIRIATSRIGRQSRDRYLFVQVRRADVDPVDHERTSIATRTVL